MLGFSLHNPDQILNPGFSLTMFNDVSQKHLKYVFFGNVQLIVETAFRVLVPDSKFSSLVVAGLVGQDHVLGQARVVGVGAPADAHRALVHVQVGTDPVAGAVQVVESDLPEG